MLEEQERRKRDKKALYKPNAGQELVHRSPARIRAVFSGNGAGKSALLVNEAIWAAQGYNPVTGEMTPVPARVVVLLDSPDKISDVFLNEAAKWTTIEPEWLDKRGRPYVSRIKFPNGSEIIFMLMLAEALAFESIELDWLFCDEPPPRQVWVALMRGARRKGRKPRFLLVGTPITAAWMRTEIYEPWAKGLLPDTECFRFGTVVNEKNLAEGYIENFSRVLTEKEKQIRLEGAFHDLDGLALAHIFRQDKHIVDPFEWSQDWPVVVAVDPHPSKAHFAVMLGVDKDNHLYVLKSLKAKLVPRHFAAALKEWYAGYRVIDIVVDSLGSQDGTGGEGFSSFIQVLRDEGIQARATTWQEKEDESFIERIRDALTIPDEPNNFGQCIPKLRIFRGNTGIISDIENVQWTKFRDIDVYKPKLDIVHKDYLACLKYALATNLHAGKEKAAVYRRVEPVKAYGQRPSQAQQFRMQIGARRRR